MEATLYNFTLLELPFAIGISVHNRKRYINHETKAIFDCRSNYQQFLVRSLNINKMKMVDGKHFSHV